MAYIKALHVLAVFIWTGNLLALTRFMGYQVKESPETQMRLAPIYRRMYNFISLPTMVIAILLGGVLILNIDQDQGLFWFFSKMFFALGLVVCDVICGHYVGELNLKADTGRGVPYKILHGVSGLFLIGVIVSIYLLR